MGGVQCRVQAQPGTPGSATTMAPPPFILEPDLFEGTRSSLLEISPAALKVVRKAVLPPNPHQDWEILCEDQEYYLSSENLQIALWVSCMHFFFILQCLT